MGILKGPVMNKLLENIVSRNICLGCGTCQGVCPQNAISMILDECSGCYVPVVNDELCINCNLCYEICPGYIVDYDFLNQSIWGAIPDNYNIGNYISGYKAYTVDDSIRYNCSSGGIITALLIYAFQKNYIDYALVTGMSDDKPWLAKSYIAHSVEDIIRSSGSKYCLAPTNIVLQDILKTEGRYAVVGLPCHIHAIRKAQLKIPKLKKRIKYLFGLFCASGRSLNGLKNLMNQLNIPLSSVSSLKYRGQGWPGKLEVVTINKEQVTVKLEDYYPLMCLHNPYRCSLCHDKSSELADLSFGDLWIPEERATIGHGKSICIVRNKISASLFHSASRDGVISISEIDESEIVRAIQPENKKRLISARIVLCRAVRLRKKGVPIVTASLEKYSFLDLLSAIKYYTVQYICKNNFGLKVYLMSRSKYRKIHIKRARLFSV